MAAFIRPCFALSLNANPFDGSSTLRFSHRSDGIDETEEVRLSVTGETGSQYQIFQRLEDPLTNSAGESLDRSVIETSSLQGSNSFGTLYLQGIEKLGFSDQLVYTSSSNGAADSLTITYRLDPNLINRSGTFMGRIVYTLRPLGGEPQDEMNLNVLIETKGEFKVESESQHGTKRIALNTKTEDEKESRIRLSFSDNFDGEMNVYQEILQMPVNEKKEEFNKEVLQFFTANAEIGALEFRDPTEIKLTKELLYKTDASADAFDVFFKLNSDVLSQQSAGNYVGKVRYTFETKSRTETLDVDLEIDIQPIFELKLEYPAGSVDFLNLMPNMPPQTKEVTVKVNSNLGKPYSVNQDILGALSNPKGDEIKKELFVYKIEIPETNTGRSAQDQLSPVKEGSSPIFYSDEKGRSAEFKVIYQLTPYRDMRPGNYSLPVKYSLSEI